MRLFWSDRALEELGEIVAYITLDSPKNALLVGNRIHTSVENLLAMPFLGKPMRLGRVRQFEVPRTGFFVVYAVTKDTVTIASVRRGRKQA